MTSKRRTTRKRKNPMKYFKEDSSDIDKEEDDNIKAAKSKIRQMMNEDSDADSDYEVSLSVVDTSSNTDTEESHNTDTEEFAGRNVFKARSRNGTNSRPSLCSDTEPSCVSTNLETDCETQHSLDIFKEVNRVINSEETISEHQVDFGGDNVALGKQSDNVKVDVNYNKVTTNDFIHIIDSSDEEHSSMIGHPLVEPLRFGTQPTCGRPGLIQDKTPCCPSSYPMLGKPLLNSRKLQSFPPQPIRYFPLTNDAPVLPPNQISHDTVPSLKLPTPVTQVDPTLLPPRHRSQQYLRLSTHIKASVSLPILPLPTLAKALTDLSEGNGRQSLVRFRLTDGQIAALGTLGLKEVKMVEECVQGEISHHTPLASANHKVISVKPNKISNYKRDLLLVSAHAGWVREVVTGDKKRSDLFTRRVVYFPPQHLRHIKQRLYNRTQLQEFLSTHCPSSSLSLDNFSFSCLVLGLGMPWEVVRPAHIRPQQT